MILKAPLSLFFGVKALEQSTIRVRPKIGGRTSKIDIETMIHLNENRKSA